MTEPVRECSTVTTTLLALAERVEKLTGRDREIGNEVLLAYGWQLKEGGAGPARFRYWVSPADDGEDYLDGDQPDPTASFDAAMTLVPEGAEWECGTAHLVNAAWANVIQVDLEAKGKAATPACALTAASLRARAALSQVQP